MKKCETMGEVLEELGWVRLIMDKLQFDYSKGIVSKDEVKNAIKKINEYLNILEEDVENM